MKKYEYLKKFIADKPGGSPNWFGIITSEEIKEAEIRLGFEFPKSLKEFWLEVGYGFFKVSINGLINKDHVNRLCSPDQIADILLLKEESLLITDEGVEYLDKEDIPFFELADMASFLVMKPNSDKPDAVYRSNLLIEEHFERFIWRLYHESPTFYLDIPDPEYEAWRIEEERKKKEEEELRQSSPARGELWQYVVHNYRSMLWEAGVYQNELDYGGEPAAEKVFERYKDIMQLNYCSNCGNLKKTPKARLCLKCGQFHDPELK